MDTLNTKLNKARDRSIVEDPEIKKFYLPFFENDEVITEKFIKKSLRINRTRKMLLITQWFVEIAEKMNVVRIGTSNLEILFLVILAESVAKNNENYKEEGDSKRFVHKFFSFTSPEDKTTIISKFRTIGKKRSTLKCFIETLYTIRNKLAHNGIFFDFFFKDNPDYTTIMSVLRGGRNKKRTIYVENNLSYSTFRDIVIRNSIRMIKKANST